LVLPDYVNFLKTQALHLINFDKFMAMYELSTDFRLLDY